MPGCAQSPVLRPRVGPERPHLCLHFAQWGLGTGLCRVLPGEGRALGLMLGAVGARGWFAEGGDAVWIRI